MIEERLVDLETKLAYQEDTIQALNNVVCEQQKQIDQLEATCKLLIDRIGQLAAAAELGKIVDEKPPHY
ncbi:MULTISPECIES: SlyX family protein [Methylocaldum]|jgi:SlyX protein|uniref:SlyX family protein n=1 Tax=unclassified Methylocaldum TaxID=2622260 RepID=UPI00098B4EF3|nr:MULTISPECIES: SlyX family protein [unclassified Methylocaldum]MBP1150080.1 SlyX protein [Methylocaldum sp. RMAD-M]MDV3243036.1 SlyX family protein [Methylocaldum sp.]MVF23187.1 SlyX family protein [Methylocaldum sp. BRCS4]